MKMIATCTDCEPWQTSVFLRILDCEKIAIIANVWKIREFVVKLRQES
jgi:hypothetical protein